MVVYLVTAAVLVVYLVLVWFLGTWLNLQGSDLWVLRGILSALGLIGAGVFVWFHHRNKKAREGLGDSARGSAQDIDLVVHDAVRRLRSSSQGAGASLTKLPVIILLGEPGSIKTTTIVNSGLDPELLAGQVYQDNNILPTQTANIWYTRQALFVDCGGGLASDTGRWSRLLSHLQPGRIAGAVRGSDQAPRAALVCFPCESFLQPGASESVPAAAKKLNARLQEVSRALGINFPVYVLFTKFDRVPFFGEYVQNLTKEEVAEVLGTTLPLRPPQGGVYAEEESRRLTKAFDDLFYSLSERRLDLLSRENQADKLSGIYEFPRELRKLRALLVDFLVSLARPSQLQSNPFLRGFYFSGVRAVTVDDVGPVVHETAAPALDAGATRMFSAGQLRQPATPVSPGSRSRRVPQWAFLTRLFNDVILKDRVALSTSGISGKVNVLRRVALIVVLALFGIWAIGLVVSFFSNRSLESRLAEAARQVPSGRLSAGQLASVGDLQHLDQLRQFVARLSQYQAEGAPLHLRGGLYIGDRLYPDARQLYFARFRDLMFGNTQDQVRDVLRTLPETPGQNDSYEKGYNALKAYLITTSNHEKSTVDFLSPVLMGYWQGGRELDPNQVSLARQQFDFYANELSKDNPYSSDNDPRTVARARAYLSKFAGIDRYYLSLLSEAGRNNPSLSFNRQFKDSADTVVSKSEVRGAFTKSGFAATESLLLQPARYLSNEEWVLGKANSESLDRDKLQQQLRQRYYSDYINQWRNVLRTSTVLGYGGYPDAKRKLDKLSGQSSPLLELFWFVSQNTNVEREQIKNAFQPVHTVVPPSGPADSAKYIQPSNQRYVDGLRALQVAIDQLSGNSKDPNLIAQANNARAQGIATAAATLDSANVDQQFHIELVVRGLLEAPFSHAAPLIDAGPKGPLNAAGQALCNQIGSLMHSYPFNSAPNAPDLPAAQLNQVFAPESGSLWMIYNKDFKDYLIKQGTRYEPLPTTVKLNPNFVGFFNNAAAISQTLYPPGSATPRVSFTLRQTASNVPDVSLKIGSETLSGTGQSKTFAWTGNEEVQVTSKGVILNSFSGAWAVSRFVADGAAHTPSPNDLEFTLKSNDKPIIVDGKPQTYRYQLQVSGANVFNPAVWSVLRCVPQVVR